MSSAVEAPIPPENPPHAARSGAALTWAVIACILLGASGAVRAMQERRHQFERSYKEPCPIDLSKLPDRFGADTLSGWRMIPGGERHLDDLTIRITGGTDHIIRTYVNDLTGVMLTVLVLYGPADPVLPHTPQLCYPATGYAEMDRPALRTIEYPLGVDEKGQTIEGRADFLSASYAKPNGRRVLREAVYHSFRLDGQWSPYIGMGRKFPRRNPGLFKVQVQRLVGEGETLDQDDPIGQFLEPFLAELEAEIKAAAKNSATKDTAAKSVAAR